MYPGERFNSISHLVGACLALVGAVVLIVLASLHGDATKIVSLSIYGVSLLALYTFSTLYHSLKGRAKRVFRHLDHTAIYLLIAGSYTPLTLVVLGGRLGWALFAAVWALAVDRCRAGVQEGQGRAGPLRRHLRDDGMAGGRGARPAGTRPRDGRLRRAHRLEGVFYTAGIVFYALDRRLPVFHGVWHLFVLAGSIAHYLVVLAYAT